MTLNRSEAWYMYNATLSRMIRMPLLPAPMRMYQYKAVIAKNIAPLTHSFITRWPRPYTEKNPGIRASIMAATLLLEKENGGWALRGYPHLPQKSSPGRVSLPQRGQTPSAVPSPTAYAFDLRHPHTWQKSESSSIWDPHSGQTYLIWLLRPRSSCTSPHRDRPLYLPRRGSISIHR